MKTWLKAYGAALAAMLVIDGIWLGAMIPRFYQPRIAHLMGEQPDVAAALAFYLLYPAGLVTLIVMPGVRVGSALRGIGAQGALFGLVAYGTYDLTNQATLRDWPWSLTVIDMVWGGLLTGAVALISSACAGRRKTVVT